MTARVRIAVLLLASIAFAGYVNPAGAAAGETYTLSVSPGRTQENNTPGFLLAVSVANATTGATYKFTWAVTDPSGNVKNAANQTVASASSFVLSLRYPNNFGTNINHVGNYMVNIQQNNPTNKPSVATGSFEVGLTENDTYERTYQVSVRARGYNSNDNITINVLEGITSAPGFPTWKLAFSNGTFYWPWQIPASFPTGISTITLVGRSTAPKNPPDTQIIIVYPTNITIPQLTVAQTSLQKTMTQEFSLDPSYLSGVQAQTGFETLRITEPDGVTSHSTVAYYNSTVGQFQATYSLPLTGQIGIWVATLDINSFDDGYGNGGPASSVLKAFTVLPATLTTNVSILNGTYSVGDVVAVYATVIRPDGQVFDNGTVVASAYRQGVPIGKPVSLEFFPGQGKWVGSFQVNATNPPGVWLIEVHAFDAYGSDGQGSNFAIVSIPSQQRVQNPQGLVSNYWLFAVALGSAVAGLAILFFTRRKMAVRKLRVDLQAIDFEAKRLQEGSFLKSIITQLENQKQEKRPGDSPSPAGTNENGPA